MAELRPTTDGVVVVRPPERGDAAILVAGRDDTFHQFLGEGDAEPRPTGCIVVDREIVGWVDYDTDRAWLKAGELNVGYNVFARHRGSGYGSRAVQLLLHHLAVATGHHTATLLIDPRNERSLALAARTGFVPREDVNDNRYFTRLVPQLSYTDGVVAIRRRRVADLEGDLEAKDDQQIDWLWLPGQRRSWEAMTASEQRAHALMGLRDDADAFVTGPKWTFAVDTATAGYVACVDCDLANEHVASGEANISYSSHPAHRGHGAVSRGVRLVLQFLAEHTGAREAHLIIDAENKASLRVAAAVDAHPTERWISDSGRRMIRYVRKVSSVQA